MEDQGVEDAMVIIQEAATAIEKVSSKLQSNSDGVLAALKDLTNKVSQLEKSSHPSSQPQLQVKPSLYVRNLVRGVYKDLSHSNSNQFILTESFSDTSNQKVASTLEKEVLVRHPSGKAADIQAAVRRYFQSLNEDFKREMRGKKQVHRKSQRRMGRKKQKLQNRRKQFQACNLDWSATRKERVKFILSKGMDYVSSEDSDVDEDGKPIYLRRSLVWMKQKYRKSLRRLDTLYYESLSSKSKQMFRNRCDGEPSSRPQPPTIPNYLAVETAELNSSVSSNDID